MKHIIRIPKHLNKDFIGTTVLDILHDSKSRSTLYGVKLAEITNLIATCYILHNPHIYFTDEKKLDVNIYFFKLTLEYYCGEMWDKNLTALGLVSMPDFKNDSREYWCKLRELVVIPLHNNPDRFTECNFEPLGGGRYSAESYNYALQLSKLDISQHEIISFLSPNGIRCPEDFLIQQRGIIDIIQDRMGTDARVVLDMKSAAGLLRSVTDAIGYINNIATNADPGRDMPGMKAIRQYAQEVETEREFQFCVKMDTPFSPDGDILDISYIYESNGSRRANITILDNLFKTRLPRSVDMSEALNQYLSPKPIDTVVTLDDIVLHVSRDIKALYEPAFETGNAILKQLHTHGTLSRAELLEWLRKTCIDAADVLRVVNWILSASVPEQWARIVYILDTVKNIECYGVTPDSVLPLRIIREIKHEFNAFRNGERELATLGYCHHQIQLLYNYSRHPDNSEKWQVHDVIKWARIPGKRGAWCNLTTQLDKCWKDATVCDPLLPYRAYTDAYFEKFLLACQSNLKWFAIQDKNSPQAFYENVLCRLPLFDPPAGLAHELDKRILLLHPTLYRNSREPAVLLYAFLTVCQGLIDIRFNRPMIWRSMPLQEDTKMAALYQMLGKFSGDFGQIVWSLFHEQIFATEDNNASAMALLLQRIPNLPKRWATIHGLGDGSAVKICIKRNV